MKSKRFIRSAPHLPVKNLADTLQYYRDQLGFQEEWSWKNKDGQVKDGGTSRDELRLLFCEDPNFTKAINNSKNRLPIIWFVENIEDVYSEFIERNIEIADPLQNHPYGLKEFAFMDINGYYVRVAEPIPGE